MNRRFQNVLWLALVGLVTGALAFAAPRREHEPSSAEVNVHVAGTGCAVQLDDAPPQPVGPQGNLVLAEVEPGDHYVHIRCPAEDEVDYFISPHAGDKLQVPEERPAPSAPSASTGLEAAEAHLRLLHLVQQSSQLRAQGRFDEAVKTLRQAMLLDPKNSDLHRELGITFLLGKDWKSARIEMLEAVHHDPQNPDAFNGLGYALEKLGNLKGAADAYRTAMRLDPGDASYSSHYIEILAKMQEKNARKK